MLDSLFTDIATGLVFLVSFVAIVTMGVITYKILKDE